VPFASESESCMASIPKKIADEIANKIEMNLLIFQILIIARKVKRKVAIPEIIIMKTGAIDIPSLFVCDA
jgi:hypothetical protein